MSLSALLSVTDSNDFARDLLINIGEATPDYIYAKDIHSRMIFANRAVLDGFGKTWIEIRGKTDAEWLADPEEARALVATDARIMASGISETLEETVTDANGVQTYLSTKSPLRAMDGRIIGLFGISTNITERKRQERLRQLLVDELDHRVRNTLAVVQVMARQTLKNASIEKTVWDAFEARLHAMVQAHGVLTREHWQGADIRQIVAEVLEVHGDDHVKRFDIEGAEVWIDAQNALALAMTLHELGTNAVKYGALAVPTGRVMISWHVDRLDTHLVFDLHWHETGGPRVQLPTRRGFGSKLIEQAFGAAGRDTVKVDYAPDGIAFNARFRLEPRTAVA